MWWKKIIIALLVCVSCQKDPHPRGIEPTDNFIGNNMLISLKEGCENFTGENFTLTLKTPSGEKIQRTGLFRLNKLRQAELHLDYGILDSNYELLHLEYKKEDEDGNVKTRRFGLGCKISFENGELEILSKWNSRMQMFGSGTTVDTLRISSEDKIDQLRKMVNDFSTNELIDKNYYFLQTDDLDGTLMSENVSWEYGWLPIGSQPEVCFRSVYDGGGYTIDGLFIDREYMYGAGLFGYIYGAHIKDVHLTRADIKGDFGVGAIAGIVTSGSTSCQGSLMENCTVKDSRIRGVPNSFGIGGLVGVVDMYSGIVMDNCSSIENTVYAHIHAGGVVGSCSRNSILSASFCENSSTVTSEYNSCGGIVACCDSLYAAGCVNRGTINGAVDFTEFDESNMLGGLGAGGIAGGSGYSYFIGCSNYGSIQGKTGVGGVLGSTRMSGSLPGETLACNNAFFMNCKNEGAISGTESVGGLCGEAQVSCRSNYNKGTVTASGKYAGGLVGMAPLSAIHDNLNHGKVRAFQYAGGIIGMSPVTTLAVNQNLGEINADESHAGGIAGQTGSDSNITSCANFGTICQNRGKYVAGIVGEFGTAEGAMDYISIVVASAEVAGAICSCIISFTKPVGTTAKILKWASIGWTIGTAIVDAANTCLNICTIVSNDKVRETNAKNLARLDEIAVKITKELEDGRDAADINTDSLGVDKQYKENIDKLVKYIQNEEYYTTFNDAINAERENVYNKVMNVELGKDITHTCISGVCSLAATALSIVAIATAAPTGGASTAIWLSIGGMIFTGIGAGNSIWQSLTSYEVNVITVNQCLQAGYIFADTTLAKMDKIGGIAGQMNSYGNISDCINLGKGANGGGHITGYAGHNSLIENCVSVAPARSWGGIYSSKENNAKLSGVYYLADDQTSILSGATALTLEQMADSRNFEGWDFNPDNGRWIIPENAKNTCPVPFISKYTSRN